MPDELEVLRVAARAAEDAGDLAGALRLVRRLPVSRPTAAWRSELELLVGDPAPGPAAQARWLMRPALRWAWDRPAGEVLRNDAMLLLRALGLPARERERRLLDTCFGSPTVIDAALFDGGVLRRYLREAATAPPAVDVSLWWARPPSVWQVVEVGPARVMLVDAFDARDVTCVPWAAAITPGSLVAGRLVPLPAGGPEGFAVGPLEVDARCAGRLIRARRQRAGPEERIRAVARYLLRAGPESSCTQASTSSAARGR